MLFIHSAFKALLFLASFYGWGALLGYFLYGKKPSGWAFPSALGIAFLIAAGGVLNAAEVAKPLTLGFLWGAGVGSAAFFAAWSVGNRILTRASVPIWAGFDRTTVANLLCYLLILLVFAFSVMELMPTRSFNYHDDYHSYLMWPVRMLQTGSLAGNPFDHIGVSSLGGQSFMHGMYLVFGAYEDINVFDAVICLVLVLAILKEMGDLLRINPLFPLVAGLLAIVINPHYANISSLYSGSLMLLGLTYATVRQVGSLETSSTSNLIRSAIPCGLFYAGILASKTTYVFVGPFFWATAFLGLALLVKQRKPVRIAFLSSAGFTALFLLPWVSLYWDRYLDKLHDIFNVVAYPADLSIAAQVQENIFAVLLSRYELFYGNTFRDYLLIVLMLLFASMATATISWNNKGRKESYLLIPFLALVLSVGLNYWLQYHFGSARLVVRYACPTLIGAAPAAVLIAGWFCEQGRGHVQAGFKKKLALWLGVVLLAWQVVLILEFQGTFIDRVKRTRDHRTLLSFPFALEPIYEAYNDYVLRGNGATFESQLQAMVPPGETILAWVRMPMFFDFNRNPIYTIDESGLDNNLLVIPFDRGLYAVRGYFRRYGIRYVIWVYKGLGMQGTNEMGSVPNNLINSLEALIPLSRVLYHDDMVTVLDIG